MPPGRCGGSRCRPGSGRPCRRPSEADECLSDDSGAGSGMPKLTLVLDRKPVQVYDIDQPVIRIGRGESMDVLIDNVSVSRRQAEIREENGAWTVRDLGSSNGTFINGQRLTADHRLRPGDEISFGKFSLFFERAFTDPIPAADVGPARPGAE